MANLLDVLRIGGNSLSAQQVAAQVTGTNISSASIDGYHRQDAQFSSMDGLGGVRDVQVVRNADAFLEAQINAQTSSYEYANQKSEGLSIVMEALGAMDDAGLNAALSDFFGAWRQMNVSPADLTVRRDVLVKSQIFSERVAQAAASLQNAQKLADDDIGNNLPAINSALQNIATLNQAIGAAQGAGTPDNALADQRDLAIRNLGKLVEVKTSVESSGNVTVLLGNVTVVQEENFFAVATTTDATTGFRHLTVPATTQGTLDGRINGGSLGAKLALRDTDIPQALASLDAFVFDVAGAVNALHQTGYGLDGVTGRNLFALPATATGAAGTLAVSSDVAGTPAALAAASTTAGLPGDSSIALAIGDLEGSNICGGGGETPGNAMARIVSDSGQAVAISRIDRDRAKKQLEQISALYEQQNGVSMDEQMMQLSRIQNAYQAAAKLIGITERMLETLQNM